MGTVKNWFLDIVFPRHCLGCDILLGDTVRSYVCKPCLKIIPFVHGFACAFCKSPVRAGKTCVYCVKNHFLDRLLVSASYENPLVEKILKTIKYRFVKSLADDVSELMIGYLKKKAGWLMDYGVAWIAPVPLHRQRLNRRGFNQAEVVGAKIAEHFGWPMTKDALKRRRNPKPQADMTSRQARIENMRNVFTYASENKNQPTAAGKVILLIDDVSTTGSTLNDCARALKGAGAKEVIGFVFARRTTETRKKQKTQKEMVSKKKEINPE